MQNFCRVFGRAMSHKSTGMKEFTIRDESKQPLILIASIGNPSPTYDRTRHSVGHYILDQYCATHGFNRLENLGRYTVHAKDQCPVYFYRNEGYMNISGENLAKPWRQFVKAANSMDMNPALVVISDELDMDPGKVKVRKQNASARGHNGLKSIQNSIGKGYTNIKIGIGRNYSGGGKDSDSVSRYVLGKFTPQELDILDTQTLDKFHQIVKEMCKGRYIYDVQK